MVVVGCVSAMSCQLGKEGKERVSPALTPQSHLVRT